MLRIILKIYKTDCIILQFIHTCITQTRSRSGSTGSSGSRRSGRKRWLRGRPGGGSRWWRCGRGCGS